MSVYYWDEGYGSGHSTTYPRKKDMPNIIDGVLVDDDGNEKEVVREGRTEREIERWHRIQWYLPRKKKR